MVVAVVLDVLPPFYRQASYYFPHLQASYLQWENWEPREFRNLTKVIIRRGENMFFWALYPTLFFRQLASVISYKPTTRFPTTSTNFWQQAVLVMSNPTETAFNLRCLSVLFESTLKANKIELFPTDSLSSREKHLKLILNWRTIAREGGCACKSQGAISCETGRLHHHSWPFSNLEVGEPCLLSQGLEDGMG